MADTKRQDGGHLNKKDEMHLYRWRRNSGAEPKRGAPGGNLNAMRHGIYANRFLSEDEKSLFDAIIAQLYQDFVFNKSSDFMQVELVAAYFLKLGRGQEAGDWEAAEKLDRMIRCHLKDLKATKIARESEVARGPETPPAEWATALLEKLV
ncbi:MAG: hypothetical protein H5U09_09880 [Desulfomicrobiaceae bacterium]|nr:hypothetical protein [Desulfomicrobiaceae bacterium]